MGDYHVHLHPHSPRPDSPPPGVYPPAHVESFVTRALSRGADVVGFTEHLHRFVDFESAITGFWNTGEHEDLTRHSRNFYYSELNLRLDRYVDAVVGARERGLPVRLGMEVDFFPAHLEKILEIIGNFPFDFLIGSVHWVGAWAVDHPALAHEFDRRGVRRAYEDYFRVVCELAESGTVQVLAHVDVVKKFGHRCDEEPEDLYRQVVASAVRGGVAVEVSSAGLRYEAAEPYPSPILLRMCRQAGVPITLASDAHHPEDAADRHREMAEYARAAGYREQLSFGVGGQRTFVPLPGSPDPGPADPGRGSREDERIGG